MSDQTPKEDVSSSGKLMRLRMIRHHLAAYREARRILSASFTSVAERKAAIAVKDEFVSAAPSYVAEMVNGLDELIAYTDGEECADPESCDSVRGNQAFVCSRCRLREVARD